MADWLFRSVGPFLCVACFIEQCYDMHETVILTSSLQEQENEKQSASDALFWVISAAYKGPKADMDYALLRHRFHKIIRYRRPHI